ncbi:MAG: ParB/RepB/Spo0J family partition protein [Anaerolineae bacterium]|nr:ParB/RepB/Spo0J family partition protein [Anaerolineae bacterium]
MTEPKRGLGRGLSALIPSGGPAADETTGGMTQLPIDDIAPNPRQPRQAMDSHALEELAASIQEHGIIQPLIVTRSNPADGGPPFRIVAGERRWRAARLAGLPTVPVVVKDATPQAMLEWALVENLQRADLSPLEMATAFRSLMDEFGLTQEDIAARVGKSRVAVANTVRLLRLPDEIKDALAAGQITEGHARALLGIEEEDGQVRALELVTRRNLSVRQTEELVRRINTAEQVARKAAAMRSPETRALEDRFRGTLGTKVDLLRSRRGGRLVIHFYSEEELQNIYDLIVGREG